MAMTIKHTKQGAERYVVGPIEQFDQKNTMFKRTYWQPGLEHMQVEVLEGFPKLSERMGDRLQDHSFKVACWILLRRYAGGGLGKKQLFEWFPKTPLPFVKPNIKLKELAKDPHQNTMELKKVASFMGAAAVGICALDRRWLYTHSYDQNKDPAERSMPVDIPDRFKWVIVLALEMDYDAMRFSPSRIASAASAMGYSKMAATGGMLAEYIRGLGYEAIPCGNDTACSIPMAIDAGLGELARNGLLITPQYGPRVRLAKVFTDMPLLTDSPIEFGVWEFCRICKKCAKKCPSDSIPLGEPTDDINNFSNRSGVNRWPVNGETCLEWWFKNGTDCSVCIRTCPFNKPPGFLHDMVRFGISRLPVFNRLYLMGDDIMGYGRKRKDEQYWGKLGLTSALH